MRHVIWSTLEDTRRFVPADGTRMPVLMGRYNVPHFDAKGEADQRFIDRGLPLTRLLTSFYWDNLIHFGMQPQRGADGGLNFVLPMVDAPLPGIAVADIGACAAAYLPARRGHGRPGDRHRRGAPERRADGRGAVACTRRAGRHVAMDPADYAALGFPGAADLANMFLFKRDFNAEFCAPRDVAATRELHPGADALRRLPRASRRAVADRAPHARLSRRPRSRIATAARVRLASMIAAGKARKGPTVTSG